MTAPPDRQVVFGREIWFGDGITTASPGHTPHGQPVQRLSMGETGVDEATLQQWLQSSRSQWTASSYHLLQHNWLVKEATSSLILVRSNSFSEELVKCGRHSPERD